MILTTVKNNITTRSFNMQKLKTMLLLYRLFIKRNKPKIGNKNVLLKAGVYIPQEENYHCMK